MTYAVSAVTSKAYCAIMGEGGAWLRCLLSSLMTIERWKEAKVDGANRLESMTVMKLKVWVEDSKKRSASGSAEVGVESS